MCPKPGAVTLRSHLEPEARDGSWKEPPTPEARARSREEQPEERRSYPTLKVRNVVVRRYLSSKVRNSSCALLEQP